mmetsp:Transcript_49984/g.50829  ORF Transcript_49984/g.50829 Transcript_49984/m.50829 type:complete len:132 (-) Transcript_49984:258-653(-)
MENGNNKSIIYCQVIKRKGHKKVDPDLEKWVQQWVRNSEVCVQSPIKDDVVTIQDLSHQNNKRKIPKILLQCSVRELHNELVKEPEVRDANGNVLVSDWKLRDLMPPEVRRPSKEHKQMCSCTTFVCPTAA